MKRYAHLMARLFGAPLLVEPRKLQAILVALGPRLHIDTAHLDGGVIPIAQAERKPYAVQDGVAVLDVMGSLVHRGGQMEAMSGLTSYAEIAAELEQALADSDVRAVVLRIDSPGGEVAGAFDLADRIYAAREQKPIYAIAEDMAASAAYLIGSSASALYTTQSGVLGSIGVVMAHLDTSEADKAAGVRITEVHAGARKLDLSPHQPLTDAARATLQAHVDSYYDLFVRTVARNRGGKLTESAVRGTEAGVLVGQAAVKAGLADGVLTARALGSYAATAEKMRRADPRVFVAVPGRVRGPVGPYDSFQECVDDNQDKDDPEAFCGFLEQQTNGKFSSATGAEENSMDLKEALAMVEQFKAASAKLTAERDAARAALQAVEGKRKTDVIGKHQARGAVVPAMLPSIEKLAATCETSEELDAALAVYPVVLHQRPAGVVVLPGAEAPAKPDGETPLKKLEAIARAKVAAGGADSYYAAFEKACLENPVLYAEHRNRHRAAHTVKSAQS